METKTIKLNHVKHSNEKLFAVRFCALWHEGLGKIRTKVLFRDRNDKSIEYGYFMDSSVYDAIPLTQEATLSDYMQIGQVDEALNTDIYSNL